MTLAVAGTFADVAAGLGFAALVLPVALLARRRAAGGDPAQAVAVGIAAVAVVLVAGGLLLSAVGGLEAAGWLALVVAADALLLLEARRRGVVVPVLLATAALALAGGAMAISRESAIDQERAVAFTQLWIVPREGDAEVGVRNREGIAMTYRVRVLGPASGGSRVLLERTVRLSPTRSWSSGLALPPSRPPEQVTAELYRLGDPVPYRRAHLWTPGTS